MNNTINTPKNKLLHDSDVLLVTSIDVNVDVERYRRRKRIRSNMRTIQYLTSLLFIILALTHMPYYFTSFFFLSSMFGSMSIKTTIVSFSSTITTHSIIVHHHHLNYPFVYHFVSFMHVLSCIVSSIVKINNVRISGVKYFIFIIIKILI